MKLLVVGQNVRNVAESARKAGHEVYALTKYDDLDLRGCAKVIGCDIDAKKVDELAESLNAKVILSSGYEDLRVKSEILGTDPRIARKILNKIKFYKKLERAGIPIPELKKDGRCIIKPIRGGGGLGVRLNDGRVKGFVSQEYIRGTPCSVSLMVTDRGEVKPISVNRILVGLKEMNAKGFTYCGNVTPLITSKVIDVAVDVVELFDVLGSVGVDFILADKPYVLEMNPRFQGSLDSVEMSLDVNLFELHLKACEGKSFDVPKPKRFACRSIVFADRDVLVRRDLRYEFLADVPKVGDFIRAGSPIASILATSNSESDLFLKVLRRKEFLMKVLDDEGCDIG